MTIVPSSFSFESSGDDLSPVSCDVERWTTVVEAALELDDDAICSTRLSRTETCADQLAPERLSRTMIDASSDSRNICARSQRAAKTPPSCGGCSPRTMKKMGWTASANAVDKPCRTSEK